MGLICKLRGHRVDRKHAWHDGMDWRASCRRCSTTMIRNGVTQTWRPFDPDADFSVFREGKPTRGHTLPVG